MERLDITRFIRTCRYLTCITILLFFFFFLGLLRSHARAHHGSHRSGFFAGFVLDFASNILVWYNAYSSYDGRRGLFIAGYNRVLLLHVFFFGFWVSNSVLYLGQHASSIDVGRAAQKGARSTGDAWSTWSSPRWQCLALRRTSYARPRYLSLPPLPPILPLFAGPPCVVRDKTFQVV